MKRESDSDYRRVQAYNGLTRSSHSFPDAKSE